MNIINLYLNKITPGLAINILFLIIFIFLFVYISYLHRKINLLTRGANGESLENTLLNCFKSVTEVEKRNALITKHAESLDNKTAHSIRNIEMIRYKAYEANGSNQSFSVALLNEEGNGIVISSLHARERISTFAKPIENYTCIYDLTDEEKEVINKSKENHKKIK